jgi:hypothetical protein
MPDKSRTPAAPRTRKTLQEKAEHALGVAERRVQALMKQKVEYVKKLDELSLELELAERRRDYLAQSPDLPITAVVDEAQDTEETL